MVHSSLDAKEFWRDAQLLIPFEILVHVVKRASWDGKVLDLGDPVGASGWRSAQDLFDFLNRTIKYAILRTSDRSKFIDYQSGEVDILVEDLNNLASLANARVRSKNDPYWWRWVTLEGTEVALDIREVGDGDLDPCWQRTIIENARLSSGGVFIPQEIDQLFSMLHHVATEKDPAKYLHRAASLARELGFNVDGTSAEQWAQLLQLLFSWLRTEGYDLSFHAGRKPSPSASFYKVSAGRLGFVRNFRKRFTALRTAGRFLTLWAWYRFWRGLQSARR